MAADAVITEQEQSWVCSRCYDDEIMGPKTCLVCGISYASDKTSRTNSFPRGPV